MTVVQRYADLYDHLPLPYVTITAVGQIVATNRAATEWLKSDAKGLVGTYFRKFLNAYDAGRFAAHIENCLRSGRRLMIELTMKPASGDAVAVQVSSRPAPAKPASPSITARCTIGKRRDVASTTSGLLDCTAVDTTSTSA